MTKLSDAFDINGMHLRNRLVLPALTTNFATTEGAVTGDILDFYRLRSKDVGLVIVEAAAVKQSGRITPRSMGVWSDDQVPGLSALVRAIKAEGAAAVLQIAHAGAQSVPGIHGQWGATPSGIAFNPDVDAVPMKTADIRQTVSAFAEAAARAAAAGFDGIEIHGAHWYLVSQFLSPVTNKRDDAYGGNARNRARMAVEIVTEIRKTLGKTYPVLFRLNAVEKINGGQSVEDALTAAKLLARAGVDAIDVSLIAQCKWSGIDGHSYLTGTSVLPMDAPAGANAPLVAAFKAAMDTPAIGVGKLGDNASASHMVGTGQADLAAIGRQLMADPDAGGKIINGQPDDIIRCKECLACMERIGRGKPVICAVNDDLTGRAGKP
ncbi:MAG: NADH:flavin oxidoreductase [Desulfobacteraceae bacterium]|nr:NADH:flavin oxidoreductase [Desulfobacteraceae bacterium]